MTEKKHRKNIEDLKTVRMSYTLTPSTAKAFREVAEKQGRSCSGIVTRLVERYVAKFSDDPFDV